jgi:hypothetical protein
MKMPVINYNSIKKEFVLRTIKIFDVAMLTILYFVIGYLFSWIINKMYYNFDPNDDHIKFVVFLEVCAQVAVLGILIYLIRNLMNMLPFPFQGIYGYNHNKVKELQSGGVAVAFGVFYAQDNIKTKLNYVFY